MPYVNRLFPQVGMTGTFVGDNRLTAMSGAHGLGVYWYNRKPYAERQERYLETGDKAHLIRVPCVNDEAYWAENRAVIHKNVTAQKKYGPIGYFAQDEGSLTCYSDEMDLCFCEHCMREMRAWLKGQYGSIEALNAAWDTQYEDFTQPIPLTREEARKSGQYASWADHRRFMELSYTDAYRRMRDYIQECDSEGVVRMSGCQASTAYTGNDYDLLHQSVRYFEAYPVGGQYEFHRSFKHPDTILGGWFGYGASGSQVRYSIWNALLHGLTLISIFWEYSMLNPDFSFSRSAVDMGALYAEIRREGIGKLLLYAAETDTMGIAIHYSMASVHATNVIGQKGVFEENRAAWSALLEDLGLQYRFLSSRQIEEGALDQGVRLLILPYSIAISDQEAEHIARFARAGGVVLGDFQTGLYTDHCVPRSSGALDGLFGIRRLTSEWEAHFLDHEYSPVPGFDGFSLEGIDDEEGIGVPRAEKGTRADGGVRAYQDTFTGHGAAVVTHRLPEGGAGLYLNFAVAPYAKLRQEKDGGKRLRTLMERLLASVGIRAPLLVTDAAGERVSGLECVRYTMGDGQVFAIKKEVGALAVKYDGLAKNTGDTEEAAQPIHVRFPGKGHLYDIRARKYLGHTDATPDTLQGGDAKLYALLPYKATAMRIHEAGDGFWEAVLDTEGPPPTQTVFAVCVEKPDGTHSTLYSGNYVAHGSTLRFSVPLAQSDAGSWRVTVKDVPTGMSASLVVEAKPSAWAAHFPAGSATAP